MAANIPDILNEEFARLEADIKQRHNQAGQNVTGKTLSAYSYTVNGFHGYLEGAAYVGTLERGRGPAKRGGIGNSDFLDNLKQWIQARGLDYGDSPEGLERLAKFLKWYINKNGNKLFRSGQHEDILTTPINEFIDRVFKRVSEVFMLDVENKIFNNGNS